MPFRTLLSAGLAVACFALAIARPAAAGEPTEQLKLDIAKVLEAVKLPEPREAVRALSGNLFDWTEMSQRALGRTWQELGATERAEFAGVLSRHVDARLITLAGYSGDAMTFVGEVVEGDTAVVEAAIAMASGRAMSLSYRMRRQAERWLIYDVVLDGTSLIASYRAQFARIIKTASYEKLLEKLATR